MGIIARYKLYKKAKSDAKRFQSIPLEEKEIVFYAEDHFSHMHFVDLIKELKNKYNGVIHYITSQHDDPILSQNCKKLQSYYVGEGIVRTTLFINMKARVLIMTMCDLETFYIKRSKAYDVHYIYIFHAMVSTHSNYRKEAFDSFDTIFMTGPYQKEEISATEDVYGLKKKELVEFGYPRLEQLIEKADVYRKTRSPNSRNGAIQVMLAPTWGKNSILEVCGSEIISLLLGNDFTLIVRPHPRTCKLNPSLIAKIKQEFELHENFKLEIDITNTDSMFNSDVLISDWSGVAMEYAFSCERPVVYIDVPKKLNNPEADRIHITPIEKSIRDQIGVIVSPQRLPTLPDIIKEMSINQNQWIKAIINLREEYVFNLGRSATLGAENILKLFQR